MTFGTAETKTTCKRFVWIDGNLLGLLELPVGVNHDTHVKDLIRKVFGSVRTSDYVLVVGGLGMVEWAKKHDYELPSQELIEQLDD